ncbi:unnamed protein product [Paramecium pentaurelia]|uniref:Uncharacterized protein n=1 Tax=Paramecium pentaurelia TaxID=43138 RepID=A0A8S1UUG1_9CILI|nr:unnamed protein product [Paramecium pentaurelia]
MITKQEYNQPIAFLNSNLVKGYDDQNLISWMLSKEKNFNLFERLLQASNLFQQIIFIISIFLKVIGTHQQTKEAKEMQLL